MTTSRRYGIWAGNPLGRAEDPARCIESVPGLGSRGMITKQCSRKRGHGSTGLYCKRHATRRKKYGVAE